MRRFERLGLAQRVVLVVATALVLSAVGLYISTLGTGGSTGGGTEYGIFLNPGQQLGSAGAGQGSLVRSAGHDLTPRELLLVWIGLILVWVLVSVPLLRAPRDSDGMGSRQ
jgi:hypothetical protein